MENPTSETPTMGSPTQSYSNYHSRRGRKITEIIALLIILFIALNLVTLIVLNYFSIVPISLMFPNVFGFLPDNNTLTYQVPQNQLSGYYKMTKKFSPEANSIQNIYSKFGIFVGFENGKVELITNKGKEVFNYTGETDFVVTDSQGSESKLRFDVKNVAFGNVLQISYIYLNGSKVAVEIKKF